MMENEKERDSFARSRDRMESTERSPRREPVESDHCNDDEQDAEVDPHERVDGDEAELCKYAEASRPSFSAWLFMEAEELVAPAVVIPWRIALLLFTSTLVQNFSYCVTAFLEREKWSDAEQTQFSQLVFNMIYLGPVFGLLVDVTRVFRERYRPVILLACVVNAVLCFACFGIPTMGTKYKRSLMVGWLMQISVMMIYVPINAVVISYGNSMLQSADESSARIGGLMAQTMVVRTFGSFVYQLVDVFVRPKIPKQPDRWMLLIAAIGSCVLIVQVLLPLTMKRSYFVDRREASFKHSAPVRFYRTVIRARRNAVSSRREATSTTLMFILCFIFVYFMLPDTLYNTLYSFNYHAAGVLSTGLQQALSVLSAFGSLIGALAYALWMFFAHEHERKYRRLAKTNPFQIVTAGCCAWAFGSLFHLIGVAAHESISYNVFIIFQGVVVQACLRFAFMPPLSLVAMHAPRGYETTAFELFTVDTSGGGQVSYPITTSLMTSMGVTDYFGTTNWDKYWEVALICVFFRFLPVLIAFSLPKHRDQNDVEQLQQQQKETERDPSDGNELVEL